MTAILPALADALCAVGLVQQAIGSTLVRVARHPEASMPGDAPGITVLKPLHGTEPLLDIALESFFLLDYPRFQLVFGAADPDDPALALVARLQARYRQVDVATVAGPHRAGRNRKIANLIAMRSAARYDLLVISDADMHVAPDFLNGIARSLSRPEAGLATTFYTGLPANGALAARLGAMQINHGFLPGAAIARALGRQDCLGATMALRGADLDRIGGFEALLDHLADDNVLGQRIRATGKQVVLAPALPATSVPETTFAALMRHELRWARTIRALVPFSYAGMITQFPLFWALAALLLSGGATWTWIGLALAAGLRYIIAQQLERRLGFSGRGRGSPALASTPAPWLFLLRDMVSAAIFVMSFWSDTVEWRGNVLEADSGRSDSGRQAEAAPRHMN